MITAYVKKELSEKELEAFLHHIAHCSDCMDELDTYYTVYPASQRLPPDDVPPGSAYQQAAPDLLKKSPVTAFGAVRAGSSYTLSAPV